MSARWPNLQSLPSPPRPQYWQFNNPSLVKTALSELWNPTERLHHPGGTLKGEERSFQLLFKGESPAQCKRKKEALVAREFSHAFRAGRTAPFYCGVEFLGFNILLFNYPPFEGHQGALLFWSINNKLL